MSQSTFEDKRANGWIKAQASRFLTTRKPQSEKRVERPFLPEHVKRQNKFNARWEYFIGDHKLPLDVRVGQRDHNVVESHTTEIVNNTVNFLFGGGVSFDVTQVGEQQGENDEVSAEEQILADFWKPSVDWNPESFLEMVGQSGAVTGTPVVRLYTEGDRLLLRVYESAMVEIISDPADVETIINYQLFWEDGGVWNRHNIVREESRESWLITHEVFSSDKGWNPVDAEVVWPHDFAPVFYCQNIPLAHSVWGISDADHAKLNDVVNEMSTDINKILHYHASPLTIAYGVSGNQLRQSRVEMGSGRILPAPAVGVDGKFPDFRNLEMSTDLSSSRGYKQDVIDAYNSVASNVKLDPAKVQVGAISGFALKLLFGPLLSKTERKRATYGMMLSQINHAILVLKGVSEPSFVKTSFGDPLPKNLTEMVQVADVLSNKYDAEGALKVAGFNKDEIAWLTAFMTVNYDVTQ